MLRADSDGLLRWTLARLDGDDPAPPPLDEARFARAGLYTGLTALVAAIADERRQRLPAGWQAFATEQRDHVARRVDRFLSHLPDVLGALDAAGVDAIPVKGAVLVTEVWSHWRARPMADIDLIVAPASRDRAGEALVAAGFERHRRDQWEDTFLLWGDGAVGRRDGESADHNGKLEIHPGWVERLHGYLVDDGGLLLADARRATLAGRACLRLSPAHFALHVLGHLSACAIRAEVRAVNVVDAVLSIAMLSPRERDELAALTARLDPRLVAPGLWLVAQYRPQLNVNELAETATDRLSPAARRQLAAAAAMNVLRSDSERTSSWAWRRSFATSAGERLAVARQVVLPSPSELRRGSATGSVAHLYAARARRASQRLARLAASRQAGSRRAPGR